MFGRVGRLGWPDKLSAWARIAQAVSGVVVVLCLSVLADEAEVAQWYMLSAYFGLVALAECGVAQLAARHFAYLSADRGLDKSVFLVLRRTLLQYGGLTGLGVLACFLIYSFGSSGGGAMYVDGVSLVMVYMLGGWLSLLNGFVGSFLAGNGRVNVQQAAAIAYQLTIAFVWSGGALWGNAIGIELMVMTALIASSLSLIVLAAGVIQLYRLAAQYGDNASEGLDTKAFSGSVAKDVPYMMVNLAAYLLLVRFSAYCIGEMYGAKSLAQFGITQQVMLTVAGLSGFWLAAGAPSLAIRYKSGDEVEWVQLCQRLFRRVLITALVLVPVVVFTTAGVVTGLLGSDKFLPCPMLVAYSLAQILEVVGGTLAVFHVSRGRMVVAWYGLVAGLIIGLALVVLAWFGVSLVYYFIVRSAVYFIVVVAPLYRGWRKNCHISQ